MSTTEYEAVPAVDADAEAPPRGTLVLKFGGTSVGDPDKLKRVAARLVAAREEGHRVVGVLSAMGHTTDELLDLARQDAQKVQGIREIRLLGEDLAVKLFGLLKPPVAVVVQCGGELLLDGG